MFLRRENTRSVVNFARCIGEYNSALCSASVSVIAVQYENYAGTIVKYGKLFIVLSDSQFYDKNNSKSNH
jgi:hypothetical protein